MHKPMRMPTAVLAVVMALFCCSGVAFAEGGGQKVDPCALLAKAEIQAVVGQNVGAGALNTKANVTAGALCEYKVGDFGAFSMLVKTTGPGETADRTMTELNKMKIATSEVPGLGDRSFFSSPGYGMIQLNTFKVPSYLIITIMVPGATEAAQKTQAEILMRKALAKI